MTVSFHALWMLCAFGVVVHATAAARRWQELSALAAGFVVAALLVSPQRLPDPTWVGIASTGAAAVVLFRPRFALVSAAWGGGLGGMLTALVEVQGLPAIVALAPPALLAATAAWWARTRPAFAPDVLRDEGLLVICLLGLMVAVVPGVLDGWQAAVNLAVEPATPVPTTPVPAWTFALVGTATALGVVYSLWSRR